MECTTREKDKKTKKKHNFIAREKREKQCKNC